MSGAQAAHAATPTDRFTVSPAVQVATGRPPALLPATQVSNTTAQAYEVTVQPARLRQTLAGTFTILTDKASRTWANRYVDVQPRAFVLAPGQLRNVVTRWKRMPPRTPAAPLGVLVTGSIAIKK